MDLLERIPLLSQLPEDAQNVILRILLLVISIFIIWALRRALTWLILRPLRLVSRYTRQDIEHIITQAVVGPSRYLIVALGISIATTVVDFGHDLNHFSSQLVRTLVIIAIFHAIYNIVSIIAITPNSVLRFTGLVVEPRLLPFVRIVVQLVVFVLAVVIVLQEWGYNVTGIVASFGLVGLAFSLAAQDTISNMFGFTAIVSDNPFTVGDFIVTKDVEGIVEHVGVRSTRIRRLDQAYVTVPNNMLTNAAVFNWSRLKKRRVDFVLGVTYQTNSQQMRTLLEQLREALRVRPHVDPESVIVHFIRFGDSSLDIRVICYVAITDWAAWTAEQEQINLAIMDVVEGLGLSIAFPTRSIYIESMPAAPRV
ncbi:MAG: mechanosensitive ion channel family protein [Anaerolineales bacterium]|nr:mechanosensitive ion channel family protein [Anaerolineales bacterium]